MVGSRPDVFQPHLLQSTVTNGTSSLSLPITLTSLCMCTPCRDDTHVEIGFELPFDKRVLHRAFRVCAVMRAKPSD